MKRKSVVENRGQLVNLICKKEKTTHQATVNAYRNAFKLLVEMDEKATLEGKKSIICMLRREVRERIGRKRLKVKRPE